MDEHEEKNILDNLDYKSLQLPDYPTMKGKKKWCRVIDVFDGDTITILYFSDEYILRKERFRLYGIDTPELKPLKTAENRQQLIQKAKEARDFLSSLILNKTIYIVFNQEEKYGRRMGNIYLTNNTQEKSVNDMLIENGHAKKYYGGKK